jgi:hypothetical protein
MVCFYLFGGALELSIHQFKISSQSESDIYWWSYVRSFATRHPGNGIPYLNVSL